MALCAVCAAQMGLRSGKREKYRTNLQGGFTGRLPPSEGQGKAFLLLLKLNLMEGVVFYERQQDTRQPDCR